MQLPVTLIVWLLPVLAQAAAATIRVPIESESGFYLHEQGVAVLTAVGDKTRVVVHIQGVPQGALEPMHIHRGQCGSALNPAPAWPLQPVTTNGVSSTTVPVSLKQLELRHYAINVHKSLKDLTVYVACGNLPQKGK